MPRYRGLPQHWIRDTQPTPYWCPLCKAWVSKWHEHHGPRKERTWRPGKPAKRARSA